MLTALAQLGCHTLEGNSEQHHGNCGQTELPSCKLFLGNAGTAMRPLTAALAVLTSGATSFELSGIARMAERPR
ncbi:MAG: hypothetical protein IPH40_04910 [Polaromonas sp.]|nr:hypothetical protein [Polaromonas sp.]